ncbi:putative alkaline shock family protein YloU [Desulfitispora alkaliphila]|uniref:Asp23/Gls24 family envelope stress response protein n=1 Tax=Desulfitispora alkaliphila TaxID=622674 RepID=UPI003D24AF99
MAENKKQPNATGQTKIAEEVVATIVGLAAEKTEGVTAMSGGITQGLAERLGRKSYTKGIKVEVGEKEAAADLHVIINFGAKIHEVAAAVRQNVKDAIENMTGLTVVEVNVTVDGVAFEEEKQEDREETKRVK